MRTDRLTLVTLTPYLARAALENRAKLGLMLGARVPLTWPGADFSRMLPRLAEGGERASQRAEQTRLVLHEEDRALIGETGFHGPPDRSGTVEVGYSIVPDYRGRGFAFEATRALIDEALARPGVCRITAACHDDNAASLKVLEKLGMHFVGATGDTLRFELRKSTP
jgi:[ribosomal protein S5]-alanine N-acetyltransferase